MLVERARELIARAQDLAAEERFLNWQVAFPGVWLDWDAAERQGGFDAVIGNPPWDRMKLQQVEWFAARRPDIATAPRAADRKLMIAELEKVNSPLAQDFAMANERSTAALRMARKGGDYPLLSGGDLNLYSLFVERAMTRGGAGTHLYCTRHGAIRPRHGQHRRGRRSSATVPMGP